MENQQQNWFKKNALWLTLLVVIIVAFLLNMDDVVRGFNDGYNDARK
jgi:predicted negative regulator of RcsB-dependent stress response